MRRLLKRFAIGIRVPAILLSVFGFSILLVAQRVYLVQLWDKIDETKKEIRSVEDFNEGLEFQIAQILETERLKDIAEEDYGLRSQRFGDVVTLAEPEGGRAPREKRVWDKVRLVARRTWETLVVGPLDLDKSEISGSM